MDAMPQRPLSTLLYLIHREINYIDCISFSNRLSNKLGNCLLAVMDINHDFIVGENNEETEKTTFNDYIRN